jgi:DNA primase
MDEPIWRLAAVIESAASFFASARDASWVPGYLAGRGLGFAASQSWDIGYAPAGWTALTDHARDLGFADRTIVAAGLAKPSARGTLIDVFRDRVTFGIRSLDGTLAGFICRAPPGASPVYLNTPTTCLYRKGSLLFGLHEALPALAAGARPVIAEGPLDAIAITSAGRADPARHARYVGVAACGTALTSAQVRLLSDAVSGCARVAPRGRASPGMLVAFDADPPGRRAAVRAWPLLREVTGDLATVPLPAGADPAGYLRDHGAAALATLLDSAPPLADLVIEAQIALFERWLEFPDGTFAALHAAAPLIAGLPPSQVARQVARVAARLHLTHPEVTEAVTTALPQAIHIT